MTCGDCGSDTVTAWGVERMTYGDVPAEVTVCVRRDGLAGCQWRRTVPREDLHEWPVPDEAAP